MKLWKKILIGMIFGLVTGLLFGEKVSWLKGVGNIFLQLINMIIPLLVFSSMTVGVTSIHDPKKMGRVGIITLVLYLVTTLFAVAIGLLITSWTGPGTSLQLEAKATPSYGPPIPLAEILSSILPKNPVDALASGNVLQVIFFSILFGIGINLSGEKGKPILKVMESFGEAMIKITGIVIQLSPYAVFALMAWVMGTFGFKAFFPLSNFLLGLYVGYLIHVFLVFGFVLKVMSRLPILPFYRGMSDAMIMAFSTCSSSATLPLSMACVQEKLGVSKNISGFMLPLGATINMNGTALYQASAAIFVAQAYGIELDVAQIVTISLTAVLTAVGTAGIPGAGFIMLTAVVSAAGLPIEGIAILAGIDRLREMGATTLNVIGDAVCAVFVSKKEGELDTKLYLSN